ncbi:MAG: DUF58 domain-containing protein [Lachnospiraceae bacterium]|nr:DUF58 domain-containing protein [Lachnospiraceae bacterium]
MIQIGVVGVLVVFFVAIQRMIYARYWNKDLRANVSFATNAIFEGESGFLQEVVENRKSLPLSVVKVKFQTDKHLIFENIQGSRTTDQYYRNDMFQLGSKEKLTRTIRFVGGRRGYYTIDSMDLVSMDLFMTRQYVDILPVHTYLYIYPRFFDSKEFHLSLQQLNGEVLTRRHLLEDPFEHRGIREYQPGDELKAVNWKATAKTGKLKVNQKNYTSLQSIRIFVNLEDTGILKKEACVEASLQICAGLCRFFLQQGMRVACYVNGVDVITGHPVALEASSARGQLGAVLHALARVDTDKPVLNFQACFGKRLLQEADGTITCFVAPNHYQDFLDTVENYHNMGKDYIWFYPVDEKQDPQLPEFVEKNVRFLHLKGKEK